MASCFGSGFPQAELAQRRADDGIRTRDPHLGKVMRYQLRYVRMVAGLPTAGGQPSGCRWCPRKRVVGGVFEEAVDFGHARAGEAPFPEWVDAIDDFGGQAPGDLVA